MQRRAAHQSAQENASRVLGRQQPSTTAHSLHQQSIATSIINLQRTYGNRIAQRLLNEISPHREQYSEEPFNTHTPRTGPDVQEDDLKQPPKLEDLQPPEEVIPSDLSAAAETDCHNKQENCSTTIGPQLSAGSIPQGPLQSGIKTVLRPRQAPQTFLDASSSSSSPARSMHAIVAPGGAPAVNNAAVGNDCLPSVASVLDWEVVDADATNWGVNVKSLALAGQINLKPWPNKPTEMVVPNTPNPVDGGNINNTAGSSNHFQAAIDDMADYNNVGGGAGPNWHSTAASSAHEWEHWNTDWVVDSVSSAAGGNWAVRNAELDALREPKASSASQALARTALTARVNAKMNSFHNLAVTRWNAIPDTAGVAGSRGYVAGMAVLNGHIAAIRTYKTTKGW